MGRPHTGLLVGGVAALGAAGWGLVADRRAMALDSAGAASDEQLDLAAS